MTKKEMFIFFLIISLPILDIFTSFTVNLPLSLGAILRTMFMLFLLIFIANYLQTNLSKIIMFMLPFLFIVITLLINLALKRPFLMTDEIQFYVKTAYFITMIFTAFVVLEKQIIRMTVILKATAISSIIAGTSYWVAIFTRTDISSYTYLKLGYSGWFFSANELSVIVIILLSLSIIYFHESRSILSLVAFSFILSMLPMIGTKTAFYGGIIILSAYFIVILFAQQMKRNVPLLTLTIFGLLLLPLTPIATNNEISQDQTIQLNNSTNKEQNVDFQPYLSSRDVYYVETKHDYLQASPIRKLFGLGYAGDYQKHPKTIEMDFFDLFFSYGIVGTLGILITFPVLLKKILTFRWSVSYFVLIITAGLCSGIAFVAGHVIFAPAVMTYVAILAIAIGLESRVTRHVGG